MNRGFTLMETLMALALFAIAVTAAADLFLAFERTSKRTEDLQEVVVTARRIVEQIARAMREGNVDYERYGVSLLAVPERTLNLRDASGTPTQFSFDAVGQNIVLTVPTGSEALSGEGVRVRDAQFYLLPRMDPLRFNLDTGRFDVSVNGQPRLTLLISFTNNQNPGDRDYVRYDVQTSISSRAYQR